MDEIEYKLKTNTNVLIVNAIDKLISTIKSKYKPAERQKFVLENEELKYLRERCSSPDSVVSLTACQGLLALVELNVLEIAHTMSTVVSLLPTAHNFSAIISTMAGLLVLDLKSRLVPGQPYKCQFSLRSPQHPFITVLEKNKDVEDDILSQMHALCTHHEYLVSSNSLELLRPVFLWLTCNPQKITHSSRPWQLLLSLPQSNAQSSLLLACISCQQVCNPKLVESALSAYCVVADAAIYQQRSEYVVALLPLLARLCGDLLTYGRDPRGCYALIERCLAVDAAELQSVSGLTLMLLADNLRHAAALYLHELFNLCLNIISKYEYSTICLSSFVGLSLQWLHLPSYLTTNALKVASKILDIHQNESKNDNFLYITNLKSNSTFQNLVFTDAHLNIITKILHTWERVKDNPTKLKKWFDNVASSNNQVKLGLLPFFVGLVMDKNINEDLMVKAIRVIVDMVRLKKELAVTVLPILVYKMSNENRPALKMECLRGLPVMATTKENVPVLVSVLNKLKTRKGVPTSLLISIYTSLAETQIRCFPYLQELLVETALRSDDLKWEVDIAKAVAVKRICDARASTHGLELVSVISSLLNRCTDRAGATATSIALEALGALWRGNAVAPPGTWRALEPRLGKDTRPSVQISLCNLLSEIPALRVASPEYDRLVADAGRRLWCYLAESNQPAVTEAACRALANYKLDDYQLRDVPEIYRRTVKLPASYCKTPADAARKPEDVLDYIPCEVWPEVYRYTNQSALAGVQHLVSKLMEREIRSYRAGVYQLENGREPQSASHLSVSSVVRGVVEFFRKHIISPSYDISESVLLSILQTLSSEFPKPLPPLDLCFIHDVVHRGAAWRIGGLTLAARQALAAPSAKRLVDNFLQGIESGSNEEADILILFDNLSVLCRTMPPNSLRAALEKSLGEAYTDATRARPGAAVEDMLFVKQLRSIKLCLENERIHEANRMLLCQLLESYFSLVADDSMIWGEYVSSCEALASKYLERMTSPSGWWEVSGDLVRKCVGVRSALAALGEGGAPLVWLNEAVDACATQLPEQEYSLRHMAPALLAARHDDPSTRDWLLQLMARTQIAFNESEDESSKLYLCDVFMLAVIVFSGAWSLEPDIEHVLCSRTNRYDLLPVSLALLLTRKNWKDATSQSCEWLCHTRGSTRDPGLARAAHRALLPLRHAEPFRQKMWTRLEHPNIIPMTNQLED